MRRILCLALSAAFLSPAAWAVEGMWQPSQLPSIAEQMQAKGPKISPETLSDLTAYPMGAVVSLGGCTGSLVSPDGLIVTNHHCAVGALQYNSTPENNLIVKGFLAKTKADELPGSPSSRVYVTESIKDVTDKVKANLHSWLTGAERYKAIDAARKDIVDECEATPGYHCRVASFYGGLSYQLIRQLEIKDVRLVYAPPQSIGKFGGDIDNWTWPRHTGDFSYLRAYVSPEGKAVPYSKDNVPYHPKQVLKVNPKGLEAGDFVMVTGYPGRTNRYRLASEVKHALEWSYPHRIKLFEDSLAIIDRVSTEHPDVAVKYAGRVAGLNNYLKNFKGQIDGLTDGNVVAVKKAQEKALREWLAAQDDADSAELLKDIDRLEKVIAGEQARAEHDLVIGQLYRSAELSTAIRLVHLAKARAKPDDERDAGYRERRWPRIEQGLKSMQRRFDPRVDQAFLVYALSRYVKLPQDQRLPALDAWLDGATANDALVKKVASLYAGSKLDQVDERLKWFDADTAAINASKDSMLVLARALQPELEKLDDRDKAISGTLSALRPRYMEALLAWKKTQGEPVYPDANSTLRVTYGTVQGVSPRDAVHYDPFTTVKGIVEKNTGKVPFNAPQAELDAIKAGAFDGYASPEQGSLPVDFLADLDITGGNSGSPALDAHGRLVGLAFDGNWASVSGDWLFNQKTNRSIQVDVRYMLWVMHHLDHADNLLREMGLKIPAPEKQAD